MQHKEFTHKDVLRIFPKVKARTLIYWSERGLVTPEIQEADGRGTRRRYSYKNLIEIGFVQELLSFKVPFSLIHSFIGWLPDAIDEVGLDHVFIMYWPREEGWREGTVNTKYIPLNRLPELSPDVLLRNPVLAVDGKPTAKYLTSMILINVSAVRETIDKRLEAI